MHKVGGLANALEHAEEHLAALAGDTANLDLAKSLNDELQAQRSELMKFQAALQKEVQEAAAQEGGGNEEMVKLQAKLQAMMIEAQQRAQAKEQDHVQKLQHKDVQWSEENQRRNADTAAEIERNRAKTAAEIENDRLKTIAEVEALDLETAAGIRREGAKASSDDKNGKGSKK